MQSFLLFFMLFDFVFSEYLFDYVFAEAYWGYATLYRYLGSHPAVFLRDFASVHIPDIWQGQEGGD